MTGPPGQTQEYIHSDEYEQIDPGAENWGLMYQQAGPSQQQLQPGPPPLGAMGALRLPSDIHGGEMFALDEDMDLDDLAPRDEDWVSVSESQLLHVPCLHCSLLSLHAQTHMCPGVGADQQPVV